MREGERGSEGWRERGRRRNQPTEGVSEGMHRERVIQTEKDRGITGTEMSKTTEARLREDRGGKRV